MQLFYNIQSAIACFAWMARISGRGYEAATIANIDKIRTDSDHAIDTRQA